jgi:hypothetical protein
MIYTVQRLMSDAQRRYLAESAETYAAEFDRLSCGGEKTATVEPR